MRRAGECVASSEDRRELSGRVKLDDVYLGGERERVATDGGKACVKLRQFKAINTLRGNLKTAIGGTYHAFSFVKDAYRYLTEFRYRFDRRFNMRTIFSRLFTAFVAAAGSQEHRLRLAEFSR